MRNRTAVTDKHFRGATTMSKSNAADEQASAVTGAESVSENIMPKGNATKEQANAVTDKQCLSEKTMSNPNEEQSRGVTFEQFIAMMLNLNAFGKSRETRRVECKVKKEATFAENAFASSTSPRPSGGSAMALNGRRAVTRGERTTAVGGRRCRAKAAAVGSFTNATQVIAATCSAVITAKVFGRWRQVKEKRGEPSTCAGCGQALGKMRTDAKHCNAACKQRAYRQRKRLTIKRDE